MSRGHGIMQRKILDRLSKAGNRGIYITSPTMTPAESASLRRAAYKLEASGEIVLRANKGRLVAYALGIEGIPEELFVKGLDGRLYRSRYGDARENFEEDKEHIAFLKRYDGIAEKHGHPHGPGILLCLECATAAGASEKLLDMLQG